MKIVFIVGSLSGGGAERVVAELASQMCKQGDCVKIIMVANTMVSYEVPKDVELIDCASPVMKKKGFSFINRIHKIRSTIKNINPDVCISFTVGVNIYSILSCISLGTKLIISERNDPRFDPLDKISRVLRKMLYPFADRIVFQTNGEMCYFSKNIQDKSVIIPNPVNPNMPNPFEGKRRKAFVSAARLFPQKNIEMAIEAFSIVNKKYKDYSYEIYGEGPLLNDLKQYTEERNLADRVLFKGATSNLYDEIKDSFGFLLSSNYEGISNSMLEAMALGIPTISTDYPSGGAREVIRDGENGFIVPVGDSNQMANRMIRLIESSELHKNISNMATKVRDEYNVKDITHMWICSIKEL